MRRSSFFFVTLLLLGVGLYSPTPAFACMWNLAHKGSPLPPCKQEDIADMKRVNQMSAQVLGKIISATGKIIWVKKEVKEWQRTYKQAKRFKDRIERKWGKLTENPLPSLVAEYNRRSPLAAYVRLEYEGAFTLTAHPLSIPGAVDSIVAAMRDTFAVARIYQTANYTGQKLMHTINWNRYHITQNLANLYDHKRFMDSVSDGLRDAGDSLANRYIDDRTPSALSEAAISRMGAQLTRLQGSSFDAEGRGLQTRLETFNDMLQLNLRNRERMLMQRHIHY